MPGVVVELAINWLNQGLEGPGAQVDDQPDGAALQGQIHVVCRLPGVQHEAVALQRSEGEGYFVGAALDGGQGQVVAEELVALEGGNGLFLTFRQNTHTEREGKTQKSKREKMNKPLRVQPFTLLKTIGCFMTDQ